jgi:aminoglycoside phosphotransferase (APT) family kinase protein
LLLEEVAPYLLARGLLDPLPVLLGDLAILDATRRHANFKVLSESGRSFLVKQGLGHERAAAIRNEARAYRLLEASAPSLIPSLPALQLYSPDDHVLVIELLRHSHNLDQHLIRTGRFAPRLGSALGHALGTLHRSTPAPHIAELQDPPAATASPWVLSLHRPHLELHWQVSNANLHLITSIQRFPLYCGLLDALRSEWRHETLVHYDVKLENLLVVRTPASAKANYGIAIVDWELAGLGDPAWDVGSLFGEILTFWLSSIPLTRDQPSQPRVDLARFPLQRLQRAMGVLWQSYIRSACLEPAASFEFLIRAVKYAGARMIQSTFERCQALTHLPANATHSLQFAFNILQQPLPTAVHLLGIVPQPQSLQWNLPPTT